MPSITSMTSMTSMSSTTFMYRFLNNQIIKELYERNTKVVQDKIDRVIKIGPSIKDGPGEVYGYQQEINFVDNNYYIKLGMSVDADRRVLKEWKGKQVFKIYTPYRRLTENLTHLLLNYCRKKIIMQDGKKHIEWFHINNYEDPLCIMNLVCRLSNNYNILETSEISEVKELKGLTYKNIIPYNKNIIISSDKDDKEDKENKDIVINDSTNNIINI